MRNGDSAISKKPKAVRAFPKVVKSEPPVLAFLGRFLHNRRVAN
jgi:hypothetical protein